MKQELKEGIFNNCFSGCLPKKVNAIREFLCGAGLHTHASVGF